MRFEDPKGLNGLRPGSGCTKGNVLTADLAMECAAPLSGETDCERVFTITLVVGGDMADTAYELVL